MSAGAGESTGVVLRASASAAKAASGKEADLDRLVAIVLVLVVGFNLPLVSGLPVTYLAAGALLPVTWSAVRGSRTTRLLVVLAGAAAISGLLLTAHAVSMDGAAGRFLGVRNTFLVVAIGLCVPALLWARRIVGTRIVVLAFGWASLAAVVLNGPDAENPWKFSLSLPVTMILLTLPGVYRNRPVEITVLVALGAVSAVNDARSATAMLILAAALVGLPSPQVKARRSTIGVLVRLAAVGAAVYFAAQAIILDGLLGQAAQERTTRQIETAGSVITGGRPELGASAALIADQPWGYGAGTLASPAAVDRAKAGMAALGYDPNNGYVENYMFGYGLEVHSVAGDLWIWYGVPGALLAVLVALVVGRALVRHVAGTTLGAVACFVGIRAIWDLAFSPLTTSVPNLLIAVAVLLPALRNGERKGADRRPIGMLQ